MKQDCHQRAQKREEEERFILAVEITAMVIWYEQIVGLGLALQMNVCFPVVGVTLLLGSDLGNKCPGYVGLTALAFEGQASLFL